MIIIFEYKKNIHIIKTQVKGGAHHFLILMQNDFHR
jgi:hypothetical protein